MFSAVKHHITGEMAVNLGDSEVWDHSWRSRLAKAPQDLGLPCIIGLIATVCLIFKCVICVTLHARWRRRGVKHHASSESRV